MTLPLKNKFRHLGIATRCRLAFLFLAVVSACVADDNIITHLTRVGSAEDSNNRTRTSVGAGEWVDFKSVVGDMEWKWRPIDSPDSTNAGAGRTFAWQAPMISGATRPLGFRQYYIEGSQNSSSGLSSQTFVFTVYPPSGVSYPKKAEDVWVYPDANAGAGYNSNIIVLPTSVSFDECQIMEDECPAINVTGYFVELAGKHPASPDWLGLNQYNRFPVDQIGVKPPGFLPKTKFPKGDDVDTNPFGDGTWDWSIPQRYRVVGSGTSAVYCEISQTAIIDERGVMTVGKGDTNHTRIPSKWVIKPKKPKKE